MTKTTMRLDLAEALASEVLTLLNDTMPDHSPALFIAGSIRRQKPTVGDIEIVVATDDAGLLGADLLLERGVLTRRHAWGKRYKAGVYKGANVDLFVSLPDRQWPCTLWLRTGPGDANKLMVTQRWKGGLLPNDVVFSDEQFWRLDRPISSLSSLEYQQASSRKTWAAYGAQLITVADEADIFALCGLPYIEPEARSVETYKRLSAQAPKSDAASSEKPSPRQSAMLPTADPAPAPPTPLEAQRQITISGALDALERSTTDRLSADGARARREFDAAIHAILTSHDLDALPSLWYTAYKLGIEHTYVLTQYVLKLRRDALQAEGDAKRQARDREAKG